MFPGSQGQCKIPWAGVTEVTPQNTMGECTCWALTPGNKWEGPNVHQLRNSLEHLREYRGCRGTGLTQYLILVHSGTGRYQCGNSRRCPECAGTAEEVVHAQDLIPDANMTLSVPNMEIPQSGSRHAGKEAQGTQPVPIWELTGLCSQPATGPLPSPHQCRTYGCPLSNAPKPPRPRLWNHALGAQN